MTEPSEAHLASQSCPLCGIRRYREVKRFDDGVVLGECIGCRLIYAPTRHARPETLLDGSTLEELAILYAPMVSGRARHFRSRNFRDYLRRIEPWRQGRRLLDVGSAHGFFLAMARDRGYEVTGIEPNAAMSAFARKFLGLEIIEGTLSTVLLSDRLWDVVTFTDSLEYLPDPVGDLRKIVDHLAPNGVVFAKVPNAEHSRLRHRLERRRLLPVSGDAVAFGPSRRVAHYSLGTLAALLRKAGLEVVSLGATSPVDSPPWRRLTGMWLEMEPPWHIDVGPRLARRALSSLGRLEERLTGRDHLSPSIFAIGRRRTDPVVRSW